jgi:hypothetical protein
MIRAAGGKYDQQRDDGDEPEHAFSVAFLLADGNSGCATASLLPLAP